MALMIDSTGLSAVLRSAKGVAEQGELERPPGEARGFGENGANALGKCKADGAALAIFSACGALGGVKRAGAGAAGGLVAAGEGATSATSCEREWVPFNSSPSPWCQAESSNGRKLGSSSPSLSSSLDSVSQAPAPTSSAICQALASSSSASTGGGAPRPSPGLPAGTGLAPRRRAHSASDGNEWSGSRANNRLRIAVTFIDSQFATPHSRHRRRRSTFLVPTNGFGVLAGTRAGVVAAAGRGAALCLRVRRCWGEVVLTGVGCGVGLWCRPRLAAAAATGSCWRGRFVEVRVCICANG